MGDRKSLEGKTEKVSRDLTRTTDGKNMVRGFPRVPVEGGG